MRALILLLGLAVSVTTLSTGMSRAQCTDYGGGALHCLGSLETPDWAGRVTASGDLAFVADVGDNESHVLVVDASDPQAPALMGSAAVPDGVYDLVLAGSILWVVADEAGLYAIDVTVPQNPQIVGHVDTPGHAVGVSVSGSYAYVADHSSLLVIDIHLPQNPQIISSLELESATGVAVQGYHAYVATVDSGLYVVDVSSAWYPCITGHADVSGYSLARVAVEGQCAAVVTGVFLVLIDVSNPAAPQVVAEMEGWPVDVVLRDEYAYVAHRVGLMQVVDISAPERPRAVGTTPTPDESYGVVLAEDRAFVTGGGEGLYIIDITIPQSPLPIGSVSTSGNALAVALSGGYAFVANYSGGLAVVDVSEPADPILVNRIGIPGWGHDVEVSGEWALVCSCEGGLYICDISIPRFPHIVGYAALPGCSVGVRVSGDYAYVVESQAAIHVVDISNPHAPLVMAELPMLGVFGEVAIMGDYLYAPGGQAGMQVVDISDPLEPEIVGCVSVGGSVRGVAALGDLALVANGAGLQVVDIVDPLDAHVVGGVTTAADSRTVEAIFQHAYVGGGDPGVMSVIDLTEPSAPALVGDMVTPVSTMQVTTSYLYVAGWNAGLSILPLQCGEPAGLGSDARLAMPTLRLSPNPTRGTTRISLTPWAGEWMRAGVYDLSGRFVRLLDIGAHQAGSIDLLWDGRDEFGREAPTGVYLVRIDADGRSLQERAIVVR